MSQLMLEEIKRHCQAADFSDDDDLLREYQEAAEAHVMDHLRRDLNSEAPMDWPQACLMAVKLLVAHWYRNREAVSDGARSELPLGVTRLLAPHRDLS